MTDELDPDFAGQFAPDPRRGPCQLYLVSPPDVTDAFPDTLAAALDAGPVAAFQFRVKGIDQHEAVRLAEPLQRICASPTSPSSSTIARHWRKGSAPTASISARMTATRMRHACCSAR